MTFYKSYDKSDNLTTYDLFYVCDKSKNSYYQRYTRKQPIHAAAASGGRRVD